MADPRRYYVDELGAVASPSGDWVKWHDFEDYKAGQRRNKSEATAIKLGLEIVHLKTRIEDLELEVKALREGRDAK